MAQIRPFAAIRYARRPELDFSSVIAPPYDVLDERGKAALQAKSPHNIVTVDLPHLPPKTVGPDSTYAKANDTLQAWLNAGILARDSKPGFYPYSQTYEHNGRTFHRRGFFALVRLSPFGAGEVVPHELTYKGPIEDRLKLMRASRVQLSPIFGLYPDPSNEVTALLYKDASRPELSGELDGVRHDVWRMTDSGVEAKVMDLMASRSIYIADGHHRYTTALQYQQEAIAANGGSLPPNHPANFCLFVLIGMQDDGLLILPTHRLIGNLKNFEINAFRRAAGDNIAAREIAASDVGHYVRELLPKRPAHTFALFDGKTRKLYELIFKNLDVLKPLEPDKSDAWRRLDVAMLQRYLLDEVIAPKFAAGELTKGYTADPDEIAPQVDGERYQIGLILQSTPLTALEELGKTGEVMPQKSTYFYPKLATGMVINSLD